MRSTPLWCIGTMGLADLPKRDALGYLLEGSLELKMGSRRHRIQPGDVIYLTGELSSQWKNTGTVTARLFWVKIKK